MTQRFDLAVIGGGAAGYFGALRAAEASAGAKVAIFEAGRRPLEKVRISGGGRCNVTHHCFDPKELAAHYPRGSREMRAAFHRFQAQDTEAWFTGRGVPLKAEADGRMFPTSDSSSSIIDCLEHERSKLRVELFSNTRVRSISASLEGCFELEHADEHGHVVRSQAECVLVATGSNKAGHAFAQQFGHTITPLAPSLFTFNVPDAALQALTGVAVECAKLELLIDEAKVAAYEGPLLITHWGVSGPVVLKLSAWAARELHAANYQALLRVNWAPRQSQQHIVEHFASMKFGKERKTVSRSAQFGLPQRLWEYLVNRYVPECRDITWTHLDKQSLHRFAEGLSRCDLRIDGKGVFKEEFVTCGGVDLAEVDFRSMQSKKQPGLFFAGEVLDIDGITGGFNFQAAWTTGWIAGTAIAERLSQNRR